MPIIRLKNVVREVQHYKKLNAHERIEFLRIAGLVTNQRAVEMTHDLQRKAEDKGATGDDD